MINPKSPWHKATTILAQKKARSLGLLTLYAGSIIGCSTANSAEPIPSPTSDRQLAVIAADATVQPTSVSPTMTPVPPTAAPPTTIPLTAVPPTAIPTAIPSTATLESTGQYMDGAYVGDPIPADRWGDMQVRAIVEGGELINIEIVAYPSSTRRSDVISRNAMPTLIQEAIANQSADIDIVTRATDTSIAFIDSLETALEDAVRGNSG